MVYVLWHATLSAVCWPRGIICTLEFYLLTYPTHESITRLRRIWGKKCTLLHGQNMQYATHLALSSGFNPSIVVKMWADALFKMKRVFGGLLRTLERAVWETNAFNSISINRLPYLVTSHTGPVPQISKTTAAFNYIVATWSPEIMPGKVYEFYKCSNKDVSSSIDNVIITKHVLYLTQYDYYTFEHCDELKD